MAKSTAPSRVVVETTIGRLVFKSHPNGSFVVRCKGRERIRIRLAKDQKAWEADAKSFDRYGVETIMLGKTPEQAYRRAVFHLWSK